MTSPAGCGPKGAGCRLGALTHRKATHSVRPLLFSASRTTFFNSQPRISSMTKTDATRLRVVVFLAPVALGFACVKRDWSFCTPQDPCLAGFVCTVDWRCVRANDGGTTDVATDGAVDRTAVAAVRRISQAATHPPASREAPTSRLNGGRTQRRRRGPNGGRNQRRCHGLHGDRDWCRGNAVVRCGEPRHLARTGRPERRNRPVADSRRAIVRIRRPWCTT